MQKEADVEWQPAEGECRDNAEYHTRDATFRPLLPSMPHLVRAAWLVRYVTGSWRVSVAVACIRMIIR